VSIGKMQKYKEMMQQHVLRPYLPETHWLTRRRTLKMLRSYSSIFIKPDKGSGGSGIIRAKRKGERYEVRCNQERKYVRAQSIYEVIKFFRKPSQRYLVQRGLRLAKYKGAIFDVRIYMQKPESEWMISGKVARVASPRKFVTNFQKGGHAASLREVLSTLFPNSGNKVNSRLERIEQLSYIIAKTLDKQHSLRELGVDLAIEKNGRIWIIEANSKPGHMLFTQLSDKSELNTILENKHLIYSSGSELP
jgi:glutathione synthase/RimK-type ligase-like ATP-grasp enzyme